jgi:hypothetical protein
MAATRATPERLLNLLLEPFAGQAATHHILAGAVGRQYLPNEQTQRVQWGIDSLAVRFHQFAHHRRNLPLAKHPVIYSGVTLQKLSPQHHPTLPGSLNFVILHLG